MSAGNVNIEALDAKMKELIEYVYLSHYTPFSLFLSRPRAVIPYTFQSRVYTYSTLNAQSINQSTDTIPIQHTKNTLIPPFQTEHSNPTPNSNPLPPTQPPSSSSTSSKIPTAPCRKSMPPSTPQATASPVKPSRKSSAATNSPACSSMTPPVSWP